jgi:hypothetical protein
VHQRHPHAPEGAEELRYVFVFCFVFFPSFILANSFFLFFSLLIDSLSLLFFVNNRR